jgi:polysaccharide pyruvyl transferase WcaK-like protein
MAMVEGVVTQLLHLDPTCEISIVERPNFPSDVAARHHIRPFPIQMTCRANLRWTRSLPILWRAARTLDNGFSRLVYRFSAKGFMVRGVTSADHDKLLTVADEFDALHIVGGGNLTDNFPMEVWRRRVLVDRFAKAGKPVVFTGQQIGPLCRPAVRSSVYRMLRSAAFVGLREPTASIEHCRRAGMTRQRYSVMGDDSFGLAQEESCQVARVLRSTGLQTDGYIAANLRIANYAEYGEHVEKYANIIRDVAERMKMPVLYVPISLNTKDSDQYVGAKLQTLVGDKLILLDDIDMSPALAKGILKHAHAAVGASYHFCTFALSGGTPTVCVYDGRYYKQKAIGISEFWGDARLAMSLRENSSETVVKQVVALASDRQFIDELQAKANRVNSDWRDLFSSIVRSHYTSGSTVDIKMTAQT